MKRSKILMSGLSVAVVAPVVAVVSCGSSHKTASKNDGNDSTKSQNGNTDNHSNPQNGQTNQQTSSQNKQPFSFAPNLQKDVNGFLIYDGKGVRKEASQWNKSDYTHGVFPDANDSSKLQPALNSILKRTINTAAVNAVDKMFAIMNKETDYSWHAIGDPVIDSVNAVRYAVRQSSKNDMAMRDLLKTFIAEAMPQDYANNNAVGSFNYRAGAGINDWLDGKIKVPKVCNSTHPTLQDFDTTIVDDDWFQDMDAVRLDTEKMQFAEYRSQELEWNGQFDSHHWDTTRNLYLANPGPSQNNSWGLSKLSMVGDWKLDGATESHVPMYTAEVGSDQAAKNSGKTSFINVYEALASIVGTIYDYNDSSQSTGHRKALLFYTYDAMGYSVQLQNSKATSPLAPYLLLEPADRASHVEHTDAAYAAMFQPKADDIDNMIWIQKIWGNDAVKYILANGLSNVDWIYKILGIDQKKSTGILSDIMTGIMPIVNNPDGHTPKDFFDAALASLASLARYQLYFDFSGQSNTTPPKAPITIDYSQMPRVSAFRRVGFDYAAHHGYARGQFDILGTQTFFTHLDGAQPSEDYMKFFVPEPNMA